MPSLKPAILSLAAAIGITACTQTPSQPPSPPPSYTCLSQSAVSKAADLGLSFLPVAHMDETEDCMTQEESDFLDLLAYAYTTTLAPAGTLEAIVEAFPTIGPATVNALAFSLIGYENDRAALQAGGGNPDDLGPFTFSMIGIFPMHDNQFVKRITVNGKVYEAPVLLEKFGLPSALALPENNPDITPANAYPPFPETQVPGIPDWANETNSVIMNAFTLLGCAECVNSEDARLTSYDLTLLRKWTYDASNQRIIYEIKKRSVWATPLTPAVVYRIFKDSFQASPSEEERREGIIPNVSYSVILRQQNDPRDAPLYGHPDISYIDYVYTHVIPLLKPFTQASDFPYREGDLLQPGTWIGYISPYMGPVFELDMNYSISHTTTLAQELGLPVYPSHMVEDALLDWMIGRLQEEGIKTASSPFPQGYLFYRPTNPRYTHGPGGWKNLGVWRPLVAYQCDSRGVCYKNMP